MAIDTSMELALVALARKYWQQQFSTKDIELISSLPEVVNDVDEAHFIDTLDSFASELATYQTLSWWKKYRYRQAHPDFVKKKETYPQNVLGYILQGLLAPTDQERGKDEETTTNGPNRFPKLGRYLQELLEGRLGGVLLKKLPRTLKPIVMHLHDCLHKEMTFPVDQRIIREASEELREIYNKSKNIAFQPRVSDEYAEAEKTPLIEKVHRYLQLKQTLKEYAAMGRWKRFWHYNKKERQQLRTANNEYQALKLQLSQVNWEQNLSIETTVAMAIEREDRAMLAHQSLSHAEEITDTETLLKTICAQLPHAIAVSLQNKFELVDLWYVKGADNHIVHLHYTTEVPFSAYLQKIAQYRATLKMHARDMIYNLNQALFSTRDVMAAELLKIQGKKLVQKLAESWETFLDQQTASYFLTEWPPRQTLLTHINAAKASVANESIAWLELHQCYYTLEEQIENMAQELDPSHQHEGASSQTFLPWLDEALRSHHLVNPDFSLALATEITSMRTQLMERIYSIEVSASLDPLPMLTTLFEEATLHLPQEKKPEQRAKILRRFSQLSQTILDHPSLAKGNPLAVNRTREDFLNALNRQDLNLQQAWDWCAANQLDELFNAIQETLSSSSPAFPTTALAPRRPLRVDQDEEEEALWVEKLRHLIEASQTLELSTADLSFSQELSQVISQKIFTDFAELGFLRWWQQQSEGTRAEKSALPMTASQCLIQLSRFLRDRTMSFKAIAMITSTFRKGNASRFPSVNSQSLVRYNWKYAVSQIAHRCVAQIDALEAPTLELEPTLTIQDLTGVDEKAGDIPIPVVSSPPIDRIKAVVQKAKNALDCLCKAYAFTEMGAEVRSFCDAIAQEINLYAEHTINFLEEIEGLEQENVALMREQNAVNKKIRQVDQWLEEATQKLQKAQQELTETKEQLTETADRLTTAEKKVDVLQQEHAEMRQQIAFLMTQLSAFVRGSRPESSLVPSTPLPSSLFGGVSSVTSLPSGSASASSTPPVSSSVTSTSAASATAPSSAEVTVGPQPTTPQEQLAAAVEPP